MARDIDILQLLRAYAAKNKVSIVDYRAFSRAVQRQAAHSDRSEPVFRDLAANPDIVLVPKLFQHARERNLSIHTVGGQIDAVFLPEHFSDLLIAEYRRIEENPDIPFPDEESIRADIPAEWIQSVSVETDLTSLVETSRDRAAPFYRLVFPEGIRPMLVLSPMVSDKLLDHAVLKVRQYLRRGGNRDFVQNKLSYAFPGKEVQLKDAMSAILVRPFDAVRDMRSSGNEFTFAIWAYLASYMKKDIFKKQDKTAEDWSHLQAISLCEIYNNFFKGKAQRAVERETAFRTLDILLRKPPYNFTFEEMTDFRDSMGRPLLGMYTREELEEWLRVRTTQALPGSLPELLMPVTARGQRWLVAKNRVLPLVVRLLGEARKSIRASLIAEWKAVMETFSTIPTMEDDEAYREDLEERVSRGYPVLSALVSEGIFSLVHSELRETPDAVPELDRFFSRSDLVPIDELLDLGRKSLLMDVRNLLPIWHALPIVSSIFAFIYRSTNRMRARRQRLKTISDSASGSAERRIPPPGRESARRLEFAAAAAKAEQALLPEGYKLDEYLSQLVNRWNTMLNPRAKADLTEDVNALVRDYLRGLLRTLRPSSLTAERVQGLAANLADLPSLLKVRNHAALEEYISLYILRLLRVR
ncbi:MAG TPA: hypothetical protein VLH39_02070 [Magnetospirillaceae bacterium]|nr:hypothetical protein [Magnetospirillaceae bacterium]